MDKQLLKNTILYLNEYSLETKNAQENINKVTSRLHKNNNKIKADQIQRITMYLDHHHLLRYYHNQIDLVPCAVIFAKSTHHSLLEALALFEMLLATVAYRNTFETKDTYTVDDFDKETYRLITNTILMLNGQINPKLSRFIPGILKESQKEIVSETLSILNTDAIEERGAHLPYKNQDHTMIAFSNRDLISELFPRKGIPENRDASKNLQIFYKDMLMHEFKKTCPICGIHIPHILIASHIKPFRDCAHICEAADHNNGLLLCRNHDFLFDQGYITFKENGKLLISNVLDPDQFNAFYLHDLDSEYLTPNRKQYLAYHRKHIFKK